jgi:hypothetical protein
MDTILFCKECGQPRLLGRKLCRQCNLRRLRESTKKRLMDKGRYTWKKNCLACGKEYQANRKDQKFCFSCAKLRQTLFIPVTNRYVYVNVANRQDSENNWAHRRLAEQILGRRLNTHEIIHHIDGNPKNNIPTNLIVISRSNHGKLHKYLADQRVILEKSGNENLGNCWNNLIVPITTAWLETTGAKVIKLWEIGQSAAEPLLD